MFVWWKVIIIRVGLPQHRVSLELCDSDKNLWVTLMFRSVCSDCLHLLRAHVFMLIGRAAIVLFVLAYFAVNNPQRLLVGRGAQAHTGVEINTRLLVRG